MWQYCLSRTAHVNGGVMTQAGTDMVGKALRLLAALGEHPDGARLSDLARRCGYPVSTTHRLLASLLREGFADYDPRTRTYGLGLRVFGLSASVSHARGFAGSALPPLSRLSGHTGEATLMSVRDGDHQLYVHHVEGRGQVQVIGEPGRLGPLHCTSMGKCLVAFAPDGERKRLCDELPLDALGPRTITDRAAFAAEIRLVRERGHAFADEEHEEGIRAAGVPVLAPDGTAIAAISVAAPAYRMPMERLASFVPELRKTAEELAVVLPPRPVRPPLR